MISPFENLKTFYIGAAISRVAEIEALISEAVLSGENIDSLPALRSRRVALKAEITGPLTLTDGDLAHLISQWPEDFTPLPDWFTNPEAAALADPPTAPVEVSCAA